MTRLERVVVVGASVSAADIAFDLTSTAQLPVQAVMLGHTPNGYFGDEAFNHPGISKRPSITRVSASSSTVFFTDGTSVSGVDSIIFGTGYSWTLPFLPNLKTRNNRVPGLYQHVVYRDDPSLLFVGAVNAGLTFKIFEWQAVLAARVLAGHVQLPSSEDMRKWEENRIKVRGDGTNFTLVHPDFEKYFEEVRLLAGQPRNGKGRELPPFDKRWFEAFVKGHQLRKDMWKKLNAQARDDLLLDEQGKSIANRTGHAARAKL